MRATVRHALLQLTMSADYHTNACNMKQERVEQAMPQYPIFYVYLSSSDAHSSIHKFQQIVSVDRDPSQCQQTIGEFLSITHMGKQRSPISSAKATPLPHVCKETQTTPSRATLPYCIIGIFRPCAHVMGSCSTWFHSTIWLAPQNFER